MLKFFIDEWNGLNPAELSLGELLEIFDRKFPDEAACIDAIAAGINAICAFCGSSDICRSEGQRNFNCKQCFKQHSITADTVFKGVRNFRAWLFTIFLMELGVSFNPHRLKCVLKIAYSTAHAIFKRLCLFLSGKMEDHFPEVSSAEFEKIVFRRSKETPAREHPIAEQREIFADVRVENDFEKELIGSLSGDTKVVYDILATENQPVHIDQVCSVSKLEFRPVHDALLELEFFRELIASVKGGDYFEIRRRRQNTSGVLSASLKKSIAEFKTFVKKNHQGISRKCLQLYLAAFWCQLDRTRWGNGSLLCEFSRSADISERQLASYVSPAFVKVAA